MKCQALRSSPLKVSDLPQKIVISINEHSNMGDALKVLINKKILSAPVIDRNGVVVGQLDVVDLVVFIVHLSKKAQEIFVGVGLISEYQTVNFSDIHVDEKIEDLFRLYDESASISNFSKRNPIKTITSNQSLYELFESLVSHHRVSVLDTEGRLKNYITQSDLIKLLYKNRELVGPIANKTLAELEVGIKDVVKVHDHNLVIEAFKQIAINGVSAVAVVDKNDKFVGDIAAHDIRDVNPESDMIDKILTPTRDYIMRRKDRKPLSIPSTSTLSEVITALEKNHVHRVWVIDDGRLNGVVSLGDVLKAIVQH